MQEEQDQVTRELLYRQAEQKQYLLAAIVDSSDDAIVSKNLDGIITTWNKGAEKLFGYQEDEVIGKHITILIPLSLRQEEDYIISQILKGNKVDHFHTVRLTKFGKEIPVSLTISPVRDRDGNIIGASKIARDISFQRYAEEKTAMLAAIVDSSNDAIVSKNLDGYITSWNRAAEKIFGYKEEEVVGKHITILIPPALRQEEDYILSKIVRGEKIDHFQTVRITKFGREVPVSLTISPIKDNSGKVIGASKIARDISDIIKTQEQLKIHAEKLEELNKAKDEFIGMASHELKTPLTSIKAYIQLLDRQVKKGAGNTISLNKVIKHVDKLSELISDLLDVSKIEAGKLQMNFSVFTLGELLDEAVEMVQSSTVTHTIECSCKAKGIQITGDLHRLEQVVINLLTNAIKYSPKANRVLVEASATEEEIFISVKDFGIGIAKEDISKIFSRFFRVEGLQPSFTGLGIGLYIAHEIVRRHNGTISLESEEGQGTTFYVRIPRSFERKVL